MVSTQLTHTDIIFHTNNDDSNLNNSIGVILDCFMCVMEFYKRKIYHAAAQANVPPYVIDHFMNKVGQPSSKSGIVENMFDVEGCCV